MNPWAVHEVTPEQIERMRREPLYDPILDPEEIIATVYGTRTFRIPSPLQWPEIVPEMLNV